MQLSTSKSFEWDELGEREISWDECLQDELRGEEYLGMKISKESRVIADKPFGSDGRDRVRIQDEALQSLREQLRYLVESIAGEHELRDGGVCQERRIFQIASGSISRGNEF